MGEDDDRAELRLILEDWRAFKKSAARWIVRLGLAILLIALVVRVGVGASS